MLTLLLLLVGSVAAFLSAQQHAVDPGTKRAMDEATAIAAAREALVAYGLAGGSGSPGALPCPDMNRDGAANNTDCQQEGEDPEAWLGRLPHSTLDIEPGKLTSGAIWYALDDDFLDFNTEVNAGSDANVAIGSADQHAAVLIIARQPVRRDGEIQEGRPSDASDDYLEGENADGDATFQSCNDDGCNDRVIGVTKKELLDPVRRRLLGEVRDVLQEIHSGDPGYGFYPWAADFDDPDGACDPDRSRGILPVAGGDCVPEGYDFDARESEGGPIPDWIIDNKWYRYIYYAVAESCAGPSESSSSCASDLLSLEGAGGQAVVFGLPQDIATYRDEHPDGEDDFANPNGRMRAIEAP